MTRKLSPLKQLLGARAGWQGASKLARKPVAMRGPVGDDALNSVEHRRSTGWRTRDATCRCGFLVCSKRGPCAARYEPIVFEPPAPAPVAAPQPAGAPLKPGQRVRLNTGFGFDDRAYGKLATVADWATADLTQTPFGRSLEARWPIILRLDDTSINYGWQFATDASWVEPLPSETPERGDWVPPAPWMRVSVGGSESRYYGHGSANLFDRRVARIDNCNSVNGVTRWRAFPPQAQMCIGFYASAALACCAAISIDLRPCSCITPSCTNHAAYLGGEGTKLAFGDTAESCARLALAAHARLVSR